MIEQHINASFTQEQISHGVVFAKDINHRYHFINPPLLSMIQHYLDDKSIDKNSLLGAHDEEIYPSDMAGQFIDYDKEALLSGKPINKYETFHFNNGEQGFAHSIKKPIVQDNKVVGLIGHTEFLNVFKMKHNEVVLNRKEMNVLSMILFGINYKQICNTLYMSMSCLRSYIKRLIMKFNVSTHKELVYIVSKQCSLNTFLNHMTGLIKRHR